MDTFGERLAYLIKMSDYKSDAKFAKDVGISAVTISNIKRGESDTTISKVMIMVNLLRQHGADVDYEWLISGKENFFAAKLAQAKKLSGNRTNPQLSFDGFDGLPTKKERRIVYTKKSQISA